MSLHLPSYNHLNFIRLLAAVMVLFSHAFPLSYGIHAHEPLYVLSQGQETLGGLAVSVFFVISGFLITQSYERTQNGKIFLQHRMLRIFPALIASLIFCVVLGAFFTYQSLLSYASNKDTASFFFYNLILFRLHHDALPGVFVDNPYPFAINGSLWTLQIEFLFYAMVLLLGQIKQLNLRSASIVFLVSIGVFHMLSFFAMGMIAYFCWDKIRWTVGLVILAMILFFSSFYLGEYRIVAPFCIAYVTFYFAYQVPLIFLQWFQKRDYSYGMYVFAFPIQQAISHLWGPTIQWWENASVSLCLTFLFAIASWHMLEKPMLRLKRKPREFLSSALIENS